MLTLFDDNRQPGRCITRRGVLAAGALGIGSLTLANILRSEAIAGSGASQKSIIFVHLDGGPPQMDTIDLKPLAPTEIRGEFMPISTSVPGVQIGELLPQVAAAADRFAFVRSLVGSTGHHDAFQCQSGFDVKDMAGVGGRPALGSIVAKLQGSPSDPAPAYIDLMQGRALVRNSARPGFLGPGYKAFRPDISQMFERELEQGMKGELARLGSNHTVSLTLNDAITIDRLNDRRTLMSKLDRIRHDVDSSGMMDAMDRFEQQAVGILTSGRLADALDLEKEDPRVLEKYTLAPQSAVNKFNTADSPNAVRKFLLARRLIEAGARVVSLSISDFDTHRDNFPRMRQLLPIVDHGLSTLVRDLADRGMLQDVCIIAWGEFGRTPQVNKSGGRDHWPRVGPVILAGGGLRTGQVIGATDSTASAPVSRPVDYKDIFATLYHTLRIDPLATTLIDPHGRPQYLLDAGKPLKELI